MPAGNAIGKRVPEGFLTAGQFCAVVGISRSTLRRWIRFDLIKPASTLKQGQLNVALFDRTNISEAQSIKRK